MAFDPADLSPEFGQRAVLLNAVPIRSDARYVLCWLQQTLRGHDHPTIDASVALGNRLGLPVLVYHGLRQDYPHASDRLHRFILGASRAMGKTLERRGIACVQYVEHADRRERGLVYRLAAHAAAVFVDEHATFVGAAQAKAFAARADVATIAVDATRLVPFRALPSGLHATKNFRAAHSPLRSEWRNLRTSIEPSVAPYAGPLDFAPDALAHMSDSELDELVARCAINHGLGAVTGHPATAEEVERRVTLAATSVVPNYSARRNNAADSRSCTQLSPYLHFGMVSPWAIMDAVDAAARTQSAPYKFYDEMLTWLLFYTSLLDARKTASQAVIDPGGVVQSQVIESGVGDGRSGLRLALNGSQSQRTLSARFVTDFFGSGVQHIALRTSDIRHSVKAMRAAGVAMLPLPDNYYEDLAARAELPGEEIDELRDLGILWDKDAGGAFHQAYTQALDGGFFFEIVQRDGYTGYGAANASIRLAAQARLARPAALPAR